MLIKYDLNEIETQILKNQILEKFCIYFDIPS